MTAPSVTAIDSTIAALARRMETTTVHGVLLNLSKRIEELVE